MLGKYDAARMGLAVALVSEAGEGEFGPAYALQALANEEEETEMQARGKDGAFFRLQATIELCPFDNAADTKVTHTHTHTHTHSYSCSCTSFGSQTRCRDGVQVIKLRPYITFTNRLGQKAFLRQTNFPGLEKVVGVGDWRAWALSPSTYRTNLQVSQ